MNLNLIGWEDKQKLFCATERPLHKIANSEEVTNIFIVPISVEISYRTRIPQLMVIGLRENEKLEEMAHKKEVRLTQRVVDMEMSDDLMESVLCDVNANSNERYTESYAVVKVILNGDDYLIQYQCQGFTDELSFTGDRFLNYHLCFVCDMKVIMLLNERDFGIYSLMPPERRRDETTRDICGLCISPSVSWKVYKCKHRYCQFCVSAMEGKYCMYSYCGVKCCEEKAVQGYIDDGFCKYDNCMKRTVVNLPCKCITCAGDGRNCSRCRKEVREQVAAK